MTFRTGTITSATPAKALFDLMHTDLIGVGYVAVETAISANAVTWNVYRSPAASNFFGQDWYFALGYDNASSATLYCCAFEDWDAVNKRAIRYAPSTTGLVPGVGYINPQAASTLPAGFTLSHAFPTSTVFTYAYSTLIDRFAIGAWTASAHRTGWYVGLYDSFYSTTDDPFPLVAMNIGGVNAVVAGSALLGATTREPMTTVSNTNNFFVSQGSYCTSGSTPQQNYLGSWNSSCLNLYQGSRPWVSRVVFSGRGGASASHIYISWPRGLLRDLFSCTNVVNNGDRVTWTNGGVNLAGVRFGINDQSTGSSTVRGIVLIPEY